MTAKEFLSEAYRVDRYIKSYLKELDEVKMMRDRLAPAPDQERVQVSPSAEAQFERAVDRIWELEHILDEEIDRLVDKKGEIRSVISQVKNLNEQMLLRYRYIHFDSWETIADELGYSMRWTYRLHGRALASVEEILEKKQKKMKRVH